MTRRAPRTGGKPGRPRNIELDLDSPARDAEDIPEAPPGLAQDGKATWIRLWTAGAHLDPNSDYLIVSELCHLSDETAEMRRALAIGPIAGGVAKTYQQGKNGSIVSHPFVNQIKDNRAMIMSWMSQLGFGTLARKQEAGEEVSALKSFQQMTAEVREEMRAAQKD